MVTGTNTLSPAAVPGQRDLDEATRGLEAYFMRSFLSEFLASSSSVFGQGSAGSNIQSLFVDALSEAMADAGGLGVGESLRAQYSPVAGANEAFNTTGRTGIASESFVSAALGSPASLHSSASASSIHTATKHSFSPSNALRAYSGVVGRNEGVSAVEHSALTHLPVEGRASSGFGQRFDPISHFPRAHHGIDLAAPVGAPVRSAGAGVVIRAEKQEAYGNIVVVDHGNGLETRYAHLDSMTVRVGERLVGGQHLGNVGSTGRSTGPHLHFEIRREGTPLDPGKEVPGLKFL